jgi:hypothetical protein
MFRRVLRADHDDGDDGLAVEYQALFGPNSLNYHFDYGRRRFILIDNVTRVLPKVHHYVICDVQPDGTLEQQVVRFHREDVEP